MRWTTLLRFVLLASIFVATPVVTAEPAAARKRVSASEKEAFQLFQAARKDFLDGKFQAAVDKLEKAYKLFPQPMILYRKAEALENLRKIEEAYEAYKALGTTGNAAIDGPTRSAMRRLESLLAKPVEVSIISGGVVDALITVDGKPFGTTPALVKLQRGKHDIRVTKEGYRPFSLKDFVVKGIDTMKVDAELTPLLGLVQVKLKDGTFDETKLSIDGGTIIVNRKRAKETDLIDIPVGQHQLECERQGRPTVYKKFTVEAEQEISLLCDFDAVVVPEPGPNWPAIGTMIGGVAAAGAGVGIYVSYLSDVELAEQNNQKLESNKQYFGPVLMGVGGIGIIASIVMFAVMDDDPAETDETVGMPALQLELAPTRDGAMFGASGRF